LEKGGVFTGDYHDVKNHNVGRLSKARLQPRLEVKNRMHRTRATLLPELYSGLSPRSPGRVHFCFHN
jgi:hypothetical protein